MLATNAAYKSEITSRQRNRFSIYATVGGKTYDNNNIVSLEFEETVGEANGIPIGQTASSELTLVLRDAEIDSGASLVGLCVTVEVSPTGSTGADIGSIPLGVFWVKTANSATGYKTFSLVCYDRMEGLDTEYISTISKYPALISAVAADIAAQNDFRLVSYDYPAAYINEEPFGCSSREMLGYIAGLCGANARFNRNGDLEFAELVNADDCEITQDLKYADDVSENNHRPLQVLGLVIEGEDTTYKYSGGIGESIMTWDVSVEQDRTVLANLYDLNDGTGHYLLEVSGDGPMVDYANRSAVPWCSLGYAENIKSVSILPGVTHISNYFLRGITPPASIGSAEDILNVSLSGTVESIGDYAFDMQYIRSIEFPASVKNIGDCAFEFCYFLTQLILPEGLETIGNYAFAYCRRVTSVEFPSTLVSIGLQAFYYTPLEMVQFGSGLQTIGEAAFRGCPFKSVDLSDCLELSTIESFAFRGCDLLKEVDLPEVPLTIDSYAFSGCLSLDTINIPPGVTEINSSTFEGCTALETLNLPTTIETIDGSAFADTGLSTILLPAAVTYVAPSAFTGCASLTDIVVAPGNERYHSVDGVLFDVEPFLGIPYNTLVRYPPGKSATKYIVPYGTTKIGSYAFEDAGNLHSVFVPADVTSIASTAFYHTALTDILMEGPENSVSGAPWYATDAVVSWNQER